MDELQTQLNNEEKKEYLKSYQKALRRENDILDEIQRLRADKMFPSVVNDGMPRGTNQSDLSAYVAILDEQIEELKRERLERAKIRADIEKRIRKMEDEDEQRVLRLRYIKGVKWEEVAVEMDFSWQHVHKIHSRALQNFIMCD